MNRKIRLAVAASGFSVAVALCGMGVASADPTPSATQPNGYDRALQGTGSDTTEEVMNGLADAVLGDGTAASGNTATTDRMAASWNAGASAAQGPFQSRSTGCNFTANDLNSTYTAPERPNGSGQGLAALIASNTSGSAIDGCLDFARSSSGPGSSANAVPMAYIPFAKDAVAYAVSATSSIPRTLTLADLKSIYDCTYPGFTGANPAKHALLPQAGSGTRKFWQTAMGLTDAEILDANHKCISDRTDYTPAPSTSGSSIQEHRGNVLKGTAIVPISIAQYSSQAVGIATDFRGTAILGTIVDNTDTPTSFSLPFAMNTNYSNAAGPAELTRDVYNLVPVSKLGDTKLKYVFGSTTASAGNPSFTSSNGICSKTSTIQKYGFGLLSAAACGDPSLQK